MNPKASLKSLKVKVRAIASRPGVSVHPGKPVRADFRASADSRSTMIAFLPFLRQPYRNTERPARDPCRKREQGGFRIGWRGGSAVLHSRHRSIKADFEPKPREKR